VRALPCETEHVTVLLLDGHNLLFRAFSSLPRSITGPSGRPINGVYGMLGAIIRLVRDLQPAGVVAAFDVPEVRTFRHELFPAYQGQRGPLGGEHAAEFKEQIELAQAVLPSVGIPALTHPGYEADDIIGTLADTLGQHGSQSIIVSTDRDLLQLVSPTTGVLVPGPTPVNIDSDEDVFERIGVPPSGVTTYKALAGDASDNIPGVAGIGSKTASSLVNQYGSLETVYDRLDELPTRTSNALKAGQDNAFLFRRVVTVVTDLNLEFKVGDLPALGITEEDRPRQILDNVQAGSP
jgi:DNA polymerase I